MLPKIFITILNLGASAWIIFWGCRNWRRFIAYRNYPSIDAIVSSSNVVSAHDGESGVTYWPQIEFQYTVNGTNYTSSRFWSLGNFGGFGYSSPKRANQVLEALRCDPDFQVFYDPSEPSFAFVRNGPLPQIYMPILTGFLLLVFASYIITKLRSI